MVLFTEHDNPYFLYFDNHVDCSPCHYFNQDELSDNLNFKHCKCFSQDIHFGAPFKYNSYYKPQFAGRSRFDHYCKNHVWVHILPILKKCKTLHSIKNKHFSKVTFEGHPVKATDKGVAHALFRVFLHFHKDTMNRVLGHYVQYYNNKHTKNPTDTLSALNKAIDSEYKNNLSFFDKWEKQLVEILAHDDEFQKTMDIALKALQMDVVLVAWCSEWKTELDFWFDSHGPGFMLTYVNNQDRTIGWNMNKSVTFPNGKDIQVMDIQKQAWTIRRLSYKDMCEMIKWTWTHDLGLESNFKNSKTLTTEQIIQIARWKDDIRTTYNKTQLEYANRCTDSSYSELTSRDLSYHETTNKGIIPSLNAVFPVFMFCGHSMDWGNNVFKFIGAKGVAPTELKGTWADNVSDDENEDPDATPEQIEVPGANAEKSEVPDATTGKSDSQPRRKSKSERRNENKQVVESQRRGKNNFKADRQYEDFKNQCSLEYRQWIVDDTQKKSLSQLLNERKRAYVNLKYTEEYSKRITEECNEVLKKFEDDKHSFFQKHQKDVDYWEDIKEENRKLYNEILQEWNASVKRGFGSFISLFEAKKNYAWVDVRIMTNIIQLVNNSISALNSKPNSKQPVKTPTSDKTNKKSNRYHALQNDDPHPEDEISSKEKSTNKNKDIKQRTNSGHVSVPPAPYTNRQGHETHSHFHIPYYSGTYDQNHGSNASPCHICQSTNHKWRECPDKRKVIGNHFNDDDGSQIPDNDEYDENGNCALCGQHGHSAKQCPDEDGDPMNNADDEGDAQEVSNPGRKAVRRMNNTRQAELGNGQTSRNGKPKY